MKKKRLSLQRTGFRRKDGLGLANSGRPAVRAGTQRVRGRQILHGHIRATGGRNVDQKIGGRGRCRRKRGRGGESRGRGRRIFNRQRLDRGGGGRGAGPRRLQMLQEQRQSPEATGGLGREGGGGGAGVATEPPSTGRISPGWGSRFKQAVKSKAKIKKTKTENFFMVPPLRE